jgi:hypothetical protein
MLLISKFDTTDINEKLEEYEDYIGQRLPEQLRKFIEKYNGGETQNTTFKSGNVSSDLKVFYGVGPVKASLDRVKPLEADGIRYLPFASDSFGNEIVMDLSSGAVSFWNHEEGGISRIADDLNGFIAICESSGINPKSLRSVEEREADLIKNGRGNIITDDLRNLWRAEIDKYSLLKQKLEEVKGF